MAARKKTAPKKANGTAAKSAPKSTGAVREKNQKLDAITVGRLRRKKVLISFSTASVET